MFRLLLWHEAAKPKRWKFILVKSPRWCSLLSVLFCLLGKHFPVVAFCGLLKVISILQGGMPPQKKKKKMKWKQICVGNVNIQWDTLTELKNERNAKLLRLKLLSDDEKKNAIMDFREVATNCILTSITLDILTVFCFQDHPLLLAHLTIMTFDSPNPW